MQKDRRKDGSTMQRTPAEKIKELRSEMAKRNLAAYLIPTDDYHLSEYVGDYFKEREYMSGFTGSAGTLVVLPERAALWTDGRYFLQAEQQLAGTGIELMKMGQPEVDTIESFLKKELPENGRVGFDGRTITAAYAEKLESILSHKRVEFSKKEDLVDGIWTERPPMSKEPVWELSEKYAGVSREEKLGEVRRTMEENGADVLLLTALDEIAWLLNLRGGDIRNTPVFLSYMLIGKEKATLCIHQEILSAELREKLGRAGVEIREYDAIAALLGTLPERVTIQLSKKEVNCYLTECIPAKTVILDKESPVTLAKAIKNKTEREHICRAHIKDGVALTRFLFWLKNCVGKEAVTEISAARKLEEYRAQQEGYIGPSFDPIIAYGAHGAVIHYEATKETDAKLLPKGLLLADTGGHYLDGTTDVTRTVALGEITEEERRAYTVVLRSHLHLGAARFLYGCCGQNLDILAREPMWEQGMDYNHGTGHGVGYLLSVHEGPQNIRYRISEKLPAVVLEEGMVISNEPGFYQAGRFGIRHENLVLCEKEEMTEAGQFMKLEPLTMVPFDRDAIDPKMMTLQELNWLNAYHERVYQTLSPYLEGEELAWLRQATNILTCI